MKATLSSLPVLVLVLAALDAVRIRLDLPHRPTEARLFVQAAVIWGAFGLLAVLPALVTNRLVGGRTAADDPRRTARAAAILLGWMAGPVVAHQVLDRHIGLGGDLSALGTARPWLELVLWLAVSLVVLVLGVRFLGRVATVGGGAALALVAVVAGLLLPWRPGPAVPATSAAGAEGRPNVLLLIWDTVRAENLTPYGYDRDTTPHLAELAARSTVYEGARSVSCFTFTSHLSMFSGVLPSKHGGRLTFTYYRPDRSNLVARAFQEQGYRTGGFVGTDVIAGRTGIRYGFERYDDQVDPPVCDTLPWALVHDVQSLLSKRIPAMADNGLPHWFQDFQRAGDEVLDNALAWIGEDDPRPWFCMINLYDAHWPYLPLGEGADRFVQPYDGPLDGYLFRSDAWQDGYEMRPEDAAHVVDLYDAEIFDLDGIVDDFLGQLGLDGGGTAVLMTSDHGEAFGEAGAWKHEDILEPQVRIPFLVRTAEAAPEGRRVSTYVSGIDVAPTLLGLAGLGDLREELGMDGLDLVAEDPAEDRVILVEDRDHLDPLEVNVALYSGPWKLFRRGMAENAVHTLHDLRVDPVGEHDVSADHPQVFEELVAELTELRREADLEDAKAPDPDAIRGNMGLEGLGYTGR